MSTALMQAVLQGDAASVATLLKQGADPESSDADSTALCHACFDGHNKIVAALVKAGADPDQADGRGFVPLHLAAARDHGRIVTTLLEAGVDPETRGKEDGTTLHVAVAQGCLKATRVLLKSGVDLDAVDVHGAPPLAYAAMHGRIKVLKALLKAGATVDVSDREDRTPLWHAFAGASRLRQEFWEAPGTRNGEDIVFVIRRGRFLIREGDREFEPYPRKVGREISQQLNPGHVQYLDAVSCADALIRAGADIHAADTEGWTILHGAMALGEHRLVSKLLKAGVDGHARDATGVLPTHAAAGSGREDLFDRCRTRFDKLDFTLTDDRGWLPLHHAVKNGSLAVAKEVNRGVKLTEPSVTELAREHGHDEIAAHFEHAESVARRRAGEPRLIPVDDAIRHLENGGFFPQMPSSHVAVEEGMAHFVAIVDGYWVQGHAGEDGTIDVDELALRPAGELRAAFESRAFDGAVRVFPKPASELPPGTLEHARAEVRGTKAAMEALERGDWLQVTETSAVVPFGDDLLELEYSDGRLTDVCTSRETALSWCTRERTTRPEHPVLMSQLAAAARRAASLRADCASGKGALLATAAGEARTVYAGVAGTIVGLSLDAGALRRATVALREDQLNAALWRHAIRDVGLEVVPALPDAWAEALEAAVTGDADTMISCAEAGVADFHGSGPRGGWRLQGDQLNGGPATPEAVAERVRTGEVRTMFAKEIQPETPPRDDAALAEIARAASPGNLMDAARRAGTKTLWVGSGWEVSIVRYVLVYFDGSQKTQTFADFLGSGPSFDLPTEVEAEVRDAVRACVHAL